jgi:hypothetical protein
VHVCYFALALILQAHVSLVAACLQESADTASLFEFLDDLFELTSRGWVKKKALGFAKNFTQVAFNGSLHAWVKQQVDGCTTEESMVGYVDAITARLWPNGKLFVRPCQRTTLHQDSTTLHQDSITQHQDTERDSVTQHSRTSLSFAETWATADPRGGGGVPEDCGRVAGEKHTGLSEDDAGLFFSLCSLCSSICYSSIPTTLALLHALL